MATQSKPKVRITIELDKDVVDYFKMLAHKEERPYQPLMNKVLRDHVQSKVEEHLKKAKAWPAIADEV